MAKIVPQWKFLKASFPAHTAKIVARLVGGKVERNYDLGVFKNFCCIRISRALNLSGDPIPYHKDTGADGKLKPAVSSGKNKAWHIFRVRSLRKYMEKAYGPGETYTAMNYVAGLSGRKGIVLYEVPGLNDASGHADCWENSKCLWMDYGKKADSIFFWEAP